MFAIRNSRLEEKVTSPSYSMVKGTRLREIENVIIPGQSTSDYILPSVLVGAGVGLLTGIAIVISKDGGTNSEVNALGGVNLYGTIIFLSPLIGAAIGLVISPLVGVIFGTDDTPINPNTPSGLAELAPYISFQNKDQKNE